MSYYEQKIAELEARIAELTQRERTKAIPVEKQLMVLIGELNDENARLKAEVERLNTGIQQEGSNDAVGRAVNVLLEKEKEIARLKAEVERLTAKQTDVERVQAQSDFYRDKLMNETAYTANVQLLDQVKHLEAQVERLTKAGDAMHKFVIAYIVDNRTSSAYLNKLDDGWVNAKQGGQRP